MDAIMEATHTGFNWRDPLDVVMFAMATNSDVLARGAKLVKSQTIAVNSRQFSQRCEKESCVNNAYFWHFINLIGFKHGFLTRHRFANVSDNNYIELITTPVLSRLFLSEIDDKCAEHITSFF